jgi:hypothetical protein
MEPIYNGRAVINETSGWMEIVIPTRKVYFFIIFFCIWLTPFTIGGVVAIIAMFLAPDVPIVVPIMVLLFWGAAITFVGRMLGWMIAGKEIIEVDCNMLKITQKGLLFSKPKIYDIKECREFRSIDNSITNAFPMVIKSSIFGLGASAGTIAFDYGMKTIIFDGAIDEDEGKYIINLLKQKKFIE